ncbi:multidrug efflux pump subunit AcrA (membrane-fusion protein) [Bradyrhizobium sp. USDA 4461]
MDQITDNTKVAREPLDRSGGQPRRRSWRTGVIVAAIALAVGSVYFGFAPHGGNKAAAVAPPAPPVTVSQPLQREVSNRIDFLGQFSAVDRVELRA